MSLTDFATLELTEFIASIWEYTASVFWFTVAMQCNVRVLLGIAYCFSTDRVELSYRLVEYIVIGR